MITTIALEELDAKTRRVARFRVLFVGHVVIVTRWGAGMWLAIPPEDAPEGLVERARAELEADRAESDGRRRPVFNVESDGSQEAQG